MTSIATLIPDVTIVIVTLNATRHLGDCLTSIQQATLGRSAVEVVVSDNQSTDGTPGFVRRHFPDVTVVEGENVGYGAGNNRGIRVSRGRYVLVLNDDTVVPPPALEAMVAFMDAHPDVGMMGPRLLNPDGTLQPSITNNPSAWKDAARLLLPPAVFANTGSRRAVLDRVAGRLPRIQLGRYDAHETTKEVDGVKGACLMVRREAIAQVGLFDENIFLHTEEQDWACRMRQRGWRVVYFPGASICHLGGTTFGRDDREVPGRRFIQKHKSNLYFVEKHRGAPAALVYRIAVGGALLARISVGLFAYPFVRKARRTTLSQAREAFAATLRVLWDREYSRRNVFREMTFKRF